jgi:hypothetical protein
MHIDLYHFQRLLSGAEKGRNDVVMVLTFAKEVEFSAHKWNLMDLGEVSQY